MPGISILPGMCGRYEFTQTGNKIKVSLVYPGGRAQLGFASFPEVFPTNTVPVIVAKDGEPQAVPMHWGFIPAWAMEKRGGRPIINAKRENLSSSRVWSPSFKERRCLVPATAFFEWAAPPPGQKRKAKMRIWPTDQEVFYMAGLWATFRNKDGEPTDCFTIITTEPNGAVKPIHNRMPAILPSNEHWQWMNPDNRTGEGLDGLLDPYAGPMKTKPVT